MNKEIRLGNGLIGFSVTANEEIAALIVSNLSKQRKVGEKFTEQLTEDQVICIFSFPNEKAIDNMIHSLLEAKVCLNLKRPLTPEDAEENSDLEDISRLIDIFSNLYYQEKTVTEKLEKRIGFLENRLVSEKQYTARQSYIAGREFGRYEMCPEHMRSKGSKKPLSQEEWMEKINK